MCTRQKPCLNIDWSDCFGITSVNTRKTLQYTTAYNLALKVTKNMLCILYASKLGLFVFIFSNNLINHTITNIADCLLSFWLIFNLISGFNILFCKGFNLFLKYQNSTHL